MRPDQFPPIVEITTPEMVAAKARAKELSEKVCLSETMAIIEGLEKEVADMHIANRFSKTKEVGSVYGVEFAVAGLTEAEFKRRSLLNELKFLKDDLVVLASDVADIVMDIEATKTDDVAPENKS